MLDEKPALVLLRGDHQLNDTKLTDATGAVNIRPGQTEEIRTLLGALPGSLGAVSVKGPLIIADNTLQGRTNMTTGANRDDFHMRGVSIDRDIKVDKWAELRSVASGEGCPNCEGTLRVDKAIEVGHIFKLGTKYSESMGANVLTAEGKESPIIMGSYGIGVGRIMASAIELYNDQDGITWPISIAPFEVVVTPANFSDSAQRETAEKLYGELTQAGIDVLLDDRDERPGVKFKDADLIGIPYRVTIGKKLKENKVEFFTRKTKQSQDVALETVVDEVKAAIGSR